MDRRAVTLDDYSNILRPISSEVLVLPIKAYLLTRYTWLNWCTDAVKVFDPLECVAWLDNKPIIRGSLLYEDDGYILCTFAITEYMPTRLLLIFCKTIINRLQGFKLRAYISTDDLIAQKYAERLQFKKINAIMETKQILYERI
jgi:hypothetical protein